METTELLDDLQNGYFIFQNSEGFKFGIDAVLLADFAKECSGRIIDLCSGNGIIPLLLAAKTKVRHIDAVEIQPEMAELAEKSVVYNGLSDRIHIKCLDLKNACTEYGRGVFDAVTVNPPYMKSGSGLINEADSKTIARHEIKCTLEDVISAASGLLKPQGRFYMVHRPSRLVDIFCSMRKNKIEPKTIRFAAPKIGREMNLVLVCGIKNAGCELKTLPPLYVYDENGAYSKEIDEIYGRR